MLGCGREWGAGPRLSGVDPGPPFSTGTACSPSEAQLPHVRVRACLLETPWRERRSHPCKALEDRQARVTAPSVLRLLLFIQWHFGRAYSRESKGIPVGLTVQRWKHINHVITLMNV